MAIQLESNAIEESVEQTMKYSEIFKRVRDDLLNYKMLSLASEGARTLVQNFDITKETNRLYSVIKASIHRQTLTRDDMNYNNRQSNVEIFWNICEC